MASNDQSGILTRIGTWTSDPAAFVVVALYALAWLIFAPQELDWHSVATLAAWLMTLFIQRAEHRDTQAIQAKLDELLRSNGAAANELTHIGEKEPEAIEREREARDGAAQSARRDSWTVLERSPRSTGMDSFRLWISAMFGVSPGVASDEKRPVLFAETREGRAWRRDARARQGASCA